MATRCWFSLLSSALLAMNMVTIAAISSKQPQEQPQGCFSGCGWGELSFMERYYATSRPFLFGINQPD